ncbi:MAG: adenylate/guanylate cyclase domain-containing protein [Nitrosopumilus sp.]|nr:adenylate/guanylate cyclase domain-containing protein [Nitrosopumilus sp.]
MSNNNIASNLKSSNKKNSTSWRFGLSIEDYRVTFSGLSQRFCVGFVDIVGSTKISREIEPRDCGLLYEIFLNSMSKILKKFNGSVIKNVGDGLLFYFPKYSHSNNIQELNSCLECLLCLIESRDQICELLKKENLPVLDYRVSVDYGSVIIMKSNTSSYIDILGIPVNMCAKINHLADKNGIIIGDDFFQIIKENKKYRYVSKKGYPMGLTETYPVYSLHRN